MKNVSHLLWDMLIVTAIIIVANITEVFKDTQFLTEFFNIYYGLLMVVLLVDLVRTVLKERHKAGAT